MSDETTELQGILDEFEHECFMLRVEASETRARDDVVRKSYERIRDGFAGRITATLGSGTLTAEQVRKAIFKGSVYATYDGAQYYASGINMQAIADELNAALGVREYVPHGEWERVSQTQEVRHVFCECGYELGMDRRDSFPFERTRLFAMPNYCQECGRKIRKAVKR